MEYIDTKIYFHKDQEDLPWDIADKLFPKNATAEEKFAYLGYEICLLVRIFEDGTNTVLELMHTDISDKFISI